MSSTTAHSQNPLPPQACQRALSPPQAQNPTYTEQTNTREGTNKYLISAPRPTLVHTRAQTTHMQCKVRPNTLPMPPQCTYCNTTNVHVHTNACNLVYTHTIYIDVCTYHGATLYGKFNFTASSQPFKPHGNIGVPSTVQWLGTQSYSFYTAICTSQLTRWWRVVPNYRVSLNHTYNLIHIIHSCMHMYTHLKAALGLRFTAPNYRVYPTTQGTINPSPHPYMSHGTHLHYIHTH